MLLKYSRRALQVLRAVNAALENATDEQCLLDDVCRIAETVGGYRLSWIGYALQDEAKSVRFMAHAGHDPKYLQEITITWDDSPTGRGPAGEAIRSLKPFIVQHIADSAEFLPWREKALQFGYQSVIALPLVWHGNTFGCMAILSKEPDAFNDEEAILLSELAASVSYGINALRTKEDHERIARELRAERDAQEVLRRILSLALEDTSLEEKLDRTLALLFDIPWLTLERKGSVFLANEGTQSLRLVSRRYLSPVLHEMCNSVPYGNCLCGKAAASGELVYKSHMDHDHDTRFDGIKDHGHYCQPIRSARGVIGILNLYIAVGHKSTPFETRFLAAVADTLAGVIERELSEQAQRRLVTLLEATPDPVTITDASGNCLYANTSASELLSLRDASDGHPHDIFSYYAEPTAHMLRENAYPSAQQAGMWEGELELQSKSGKALPASLLVMSHRGSDGESTYLSTIARDISDRLRAERTAQALAVREHNFANSIINSLPGIFYLIDTRGRLIRWNNNLVTTLGYSEQQLATMHINKLLANDSLPLMQQSLECIHSMGSAEIEIDLRTHDGESIPYYITGTLIEHQDAGTGIVGIGMDIRYRKKLEMELQARATTDALTGCFNRLKIEETLEHEINRSKRYNTPVTLAMFDIDYFKRVNDTYGHDKGDEVLKAFAGITRAQLRDVDLLARWGGEEFMIVSPETTLDDMYKLAERIRSAVEGSTSVPGITITASFGVGQFKFGETQRELIKRVDAALYFAKSCGRNQVKIAS